MSNLTLRGNPAGTGTFTVESPNSNNNRTLTLPDATTTLVGTDAEQILTNKTIQGGALTLMPTQSAVGQSSVEFTGIPSWAKRITMNLADVSPSVTATFSIQLGTSSGWDSTGTYSYANWAVLNGGATSAIASNIAGAFNLQFGGDTSSSHGSFVLTLAGANTWIISGLQVTPTTYVGGSGISGRKTLTGTLDRVRLALLVSGNFDAGTVNVMYEG